LRPANLPNFALDRLSRYEATLWRQAAQVLYALEVLDRRAIRSFPDFPSPYRWLAAALGDQQGDL